MIEMRFLSSLKAHTFTLLFCSHSLVCKCQAVRSYQDLYLQIPTCILVSVSSPVSFISKNCHISDSVLKYSNLFTKVSLHNKSFHPNTLEKAKGFCFLLPDSFFFFFCTFLKDHSRLFFIVFRLVPEISSICVSYERILLYWAFEYLTFQRCCLLMCLGDYDVLPGGCFLPSDSYLAVQTAVG